MDTVGFDLEDRGLVELKMDFATRENFTTSSQLDTFQLPQTDTVGSTRNRLWNTEFPHRTLWACEPPLSPDVCGHLEALGIKTVFEALTGSRMMERDYVPSEVCQLSS